VDDNPYKSPQTLPEAAPPRGTFQPTLGRICLYFHAATVAATAFWSLEDSGRVTLNSIVAIPVWGFAVPGLLLLFISPFIYITMLWRAVFQDKKYGWFALAEFLLWLTHLFVLLPTVQ
jgi:hypothetical protein